MAAVKFRLNKPKDDQGNLKTTPVSIQVWYHHAGIEVELATGLKVLPEQWNGARVTGAKDATRKNNALSKLERALLDVHIDHRDKSPEDHEAIVRGIIKGTDPAISQKKTIYEWIENFTESAKVKPSTKQIYRSSLAHLRKYSTSLTWDSFTIEFYIDFTEYLYSIGLADNTVGKIIKTIKTFIGAAFEQDQHTNLSYKKKGFKVVSSEADEIYLSEEEIIAYYNVDLSGRPELEESRKKFVFDCWVGLRFGDLSKINSNHILKSLSGYFIKITTEKTGEDVTIPLHPIAVEIWKTWENKPPRYIANPTFNKHIKEIAKLAGLDSMVQRRRTVKGVVKIEWVPKWKMVKAHTCRRSFATNCYLMGVPVKTIMAITGHKTEKAFMRYIRVTKQQHADVMMSYFNQKGETIMRKAN